MNKLVLYVFCAACLLAVSAPLYAQGGCTNSPENPTLVLAAVGSAGGLFSAMRARKARRDRSQ